MEQAILHTERLLLRPVEPADQQKIFEGFSHPEVTRYFDITYPTFESTAVQMEWYANNRNENSGYAWVVCDKHTQEFMGVFSLYYINTKHQRAELGYWLLPPFWNKGYATEILTAILHHAKTDLHLHRIAAEVEQGNTASIQLLGKNGFERDGILRDYEIKDGKFQHLEIWAVLL